MYGTVARLRVKPGLMANVEQDMKQYEQLKISGYVGTTLYRMDRDPNELYLTVVFKDKASYAANAEDPRQDERFRKLRASLVDDPEWHDGEVIWSETGSPS
jgi:quinol monooxygenase YgiN